MKVRISFLLVVLQFALATVLVLGVPPTRHQPGFSVFLLVLGVALGVWAVLAMRRSRLRVFPEPAADATLVTAGPYQVIRHPMYTGLLTAFAGVLLTDPCLYRTVVYLALLAVLICKLQREERMLDRRFSDYAEYRLRTCRLIPHLW